MHPHTRSHSSASPASDGPNRESPLSAVRNDPAPSPSPPTPHDDPIDRSPLLRHSDAYPANHKSIIHPSDQSLTLPHPPSPPPNPSSIAHDNLNLPPLQFAMPHRIDSAATRLREDEAHSSLVPAHPSPPPIATLSQSPSLSTSSLDRSSVSSPAPTGRTSVSSMLPPTSYASQVHYSAVEPDRTGRLYYHHAPPPHSLHSHEPTYKVHAVDPTYATNGSGHRAPHPYPPPSHVVPSQISAPPHQGHEHGAYPYPGQPHNYGVMYTDDASMKLSDRVRRRCFNCCTTDTSTWRRSSLNPGKVLCNKCGLFERTHSRPRPDQFPHKRGPLASSSLKARTSPQQHHVMPPQTGSLPPHAYSHPSIAPLLARGDAQRLPQITSWADPPPAPRSPERRASIPVRARSP